MNDPTLTEFSKEWYELAEAARLLGVHFTTLRRWADAGKIAHMRTPSGHRKFHRSVLAAWVTAGKAGEGEGVKGDRPESGAALALAPLELQTLHQTRVSTEALALRPGNWMEQMSPEQRIAFRYSGQRLLALLMQVTAHQDPEPYLEEARRLALDYGEVACRAGMSAPQLVEAFLFFRRSILVSLHATAPLSSSHDPEGQRMFERTNDFFDIFLMATLDHFIKLDQQRRT